MSRGTSIDELYTKLGAQILRATGRPWWRKAGIQARPATPYATIHITEGVGLEKPFVETVATEITETEPFKQVPWGTQTLYVAVEFLKSADNNSANDAATRLIQSLYQEERFWDLWEVCSLSGPANRIDVSAMFRADIEPRVDVRFRLIANITTPEPLADVNIWDINSQEVIVTHVGQDGVETEFSVTVNNVEED